jgi:hypothetical protein
MSVRPEPWPAGRIVAGARIESVGALDIGDSARFGPDLARGASLVALTGFHADDIISSPNATDRSQR